VIHKPENKRQGILWMLATYFFFVLLDATVKYGMESMSLVQVTWARFFFATVFTVILSWRDLSRLIKTDAPGIQAVRSLLLMITTGFFNAGLARVPLPTASTIMYLSPIFVTLLSIIILREQVGWRRWFGIAMGFLGAIIIIDPLNTSGLQSMNTGTFFLVAAALANASYQISTRRLRHDDPMTSLLLTGVVGTIVTSLMLPWFWVWPTPTQWLVLAGTGFFGLLGHFCLIRAFTLAPASVVAPFSYSSLIWATLLGLAIWGDFPTPNSWLGAALIVTAGLYIFFRERRLQTAP
jgi:drug/metabolite transporter (DMT)-like permease